ncbi:transposase [Alsobacter sp. R-9]
MRRSQHTDEEIAALLAEADRGVPVETICADARVSLRTFYRWRQRLGSLPPPAVRRLQELEQENRQLRAMLVRLAGAPPRIEEGSISGLMQARAGGSRKEPGSRSAAGYRNCRRG